MPGSLRLLVLVLALAPVAPVAARVDSACKQDREKLCRGITSGGGRIRACLRQHQSELSDACRQQMQSVFGGDACSGDVEKLCRGVEPGGGRIRDCLRQHRDQLSEPCAEHVRLAVKRFGACADDAEKFCSGRSDKRACLREHRDKLSKACAQMHDRSRSRLRLQQ